MVDYESVRALRDQGVPNFEIAKRLGISRRTVGRALAAHKPATVRPAKKPESFVEMVTRQLKEHAARLDAERETVDATLKALR